MKNGVAQVVARQRARFVARGFDSGFVPCATSMRRVVQVSRNTTRVAWTVKLALEIWNAARNKVLKAAYVRVTIDGDATSAPASPAKSGGSPTSVTTTTKVTTTTIKASAPTTTSPPVTTPVPTTAPRAAGPLSVSTTNRWAGFFEIPGAVSEASATWVVPTLTCSGSTTATSSTWVGIGGISGGNLLQAGMYDNCVGGIQEHGAFAEEFPGSTSSFQLPIRVGDTITATIDDGAGGWEATVTDLTTAQEEIATAADYTGGTSAEWEVEDYGQPTYPLSNWGSESFTALTVNGASAFPTQAYEMLAADGSVVASPSNPSGGVYRIAYQ